MIFQLGHFLFLNFLSNLRLEKEGSAFAIRNIEDLLKVSEIHKQINSQSVVQENNESINLQYLHAILSQIVI